MTEPAAIGCGITKKKLPPRFIFNIARDITLLQAALSANPWQLGKNKWLDVVGVIKETYQCEIKSRTAKERLDLLVSKFKKEELESKTGTEEQKAERIDLLQEVIAVQEQENLPIIQAIGAESTEINTNEKERRKERIVADQERDDLLNMQNATPSTSTMTSTTPTPTNTSNDAAPSPLRNRVKRTKAAREYDMIMKRHMHDIDMEKRRQLFQEEIENRKYELELLREKRMADEVAARIAMDTRNAEKEEREKSLLLAITNLMGAIQHNHSVASGVENQNK